MPRFLALGLAGLTAVVALSPRPALAQESLAVACSGGVAQVGSVAYACSGIDLAARLPLSAFTPSAPSSANEIWGWTDPVTGNEIALVGLSNGVGFVDVTAPEAPVYLGKLSSATGGNNSWRTFRVYADHLFVGSEASGHGVQVFNLTRLRGAAVPTTFTHDTRYTRVGNVHTLVVDEQSGFLYLAGSTSTSGTSNPTCTEGGLHIVDVRNPLSPTYAGCYQGDGYTHEAQCLTYDGPDTDHVGKELCFAYQGGEGSVFQGEVAIVDMTDKAAPVRIAQGNYPNVGYSHQGWLTDDRTRILINDEFDESTQGARTIVMNVTDLDSPEFEFNYHAPVATYAHNLYIRGQYAFMSNYESGLRIVDLSDIASGQMTEVASFDTYQQGNSFQYEGQWMNYPYFASGTVIASDINNGLFVLRPTGLVVAGEAEAPLAGAFSLGTPAPNPTTGSATLALRVEAPQAVRAALLDVTGREVAVLFDGAVADAASLTVTTDGLASGVYVIRVVGETFSASRRLSVAR